MKSLNEDLKTGQFKQVYLLYGEESYLREYYLGALRKALVLRALRSSIITGWREKT